MSHPNVDGDEPTRVLSPGAAPATRPSRRPALLIGAGAAVAAVAVVGTLVLWPDDPSVENSRPQLPAVPVASPSPTPVAATSEPARTPERARTSRESTPARPRNPSVPVPPPRPPTTSSTTPTPTPTSTVVPLPPP